MRLAKKVAAALLCAATVLSVSPTFEAKAAKINSYTYNYDYWGHEYESPDVYKPIEFIDGVSLGVDLIRGGQSLFVIDNLLYIVDSGTNRIIEIKLNKEGAELVREIKEFTVSDPNNIPDNFLEPIRDSNGNLTGEKKAPSEFPFTFNQPSDIFVTKNGDMYIADTSNHRVLHMTNDLVLIKVIYLPSDNTVEQQKDFLPTKLAVDPAGRILVTAKNVNKGIFRFEYNGEFLGFMGATKVKISFKDRLTMLFASEEKKNLMGAAVPTEYSNVYIDGNAFVYCVTDSVDEAEADAGTATPIRKLNSYGDDILIRNGWEAPMGDIVWDDTEGYNGPSLMADITAMDDESYYCIDRVRGRIFGYNDQGQLLYAFGSPGNKLGYFTTPTAIEHYGTDLLVLDYFSGGVTRFRRTEFGSMLHSALDLYQDGKYEESGDVWREVIKQNGDYEYAYIGIGRALLREKKYGEALKYFETMKDSKNYSRAWKKYRKEWIEKNMGVVVAVIIVLACISPVIKTIKKIRWEARLEYEYERKQRKKKNK
mgnify:CR=1 FL=1